MGKAAVKTLKQRKANGTPLTSRKFVEGRGPSRKHAEPTLQNVPPMRFALTNGSHVAYPAARKLFKEFL